VDEGDSDLADIVGLTADWDESKKDTYSSFGYLNSETKPRVFKSQLFDTEAENKSVNPSTTKVSFNRNLDYCEYKEPKHLPVFLYAGDKNNDYYADDESDKKSSFSIEPLQDKSLKGILKKKARVHQKSQ